MYSQTLTMQNEDLLTELKSFVAETLAADAAPDVFVPNRINAFGSTCLWIGFACMFVSCLYFLQAAMSRKASDRTFEMLTFFICAIASLAYLVMASGHGYIQLGHAQPLYYARYVDWLLTTPLMLWDLLELAGADGSVIFIAVTMDALMICAGLIGALLIEHQIRWAFFVFGCVFFLFVVNDLVAHMNSNQFGSAAQAVYGNVTKLTIVMWTLYPVAWALTEGTDIIGANAACLMYTVLDVISKCVFGFLIVANRSALDSIYTQKDGYSSITDERKL